jgi:hypothetical protein
LAFTFDEIAFSLFSGLKNAMHIAFLLLFYVLSKHIPFHSNKDIY